jgi:hypothetical protein
MVPLVVMFLWALPMEAEINRGVLQGIVTDPNGAVVPGVDVTVTSVDTNVASVTKTNDTGYYRVGNLIPGKHRALFAHSGFSPLEIADIEITAGTESRLDAQIKVGATRQTIEVPAQIGLVETAPSNSSTTLEPNTVTDIPLAGRDLLQLAFLVPGVNPVSGPPGSNFGFSSQYGTFPDPSNVFGSAVEVNGGSGGTNAWYLDGNLNVSGVADNVALSPSPDAVQEFQAVTNAFSAEYGHTGGGVFNVVLKSGTNAVHGNLYEFVRNSATNARNPFTSIDSQGHIIPDRQLHFNNFGGTLGGPVILPKLYNGKDKTFFFFSYDARILHLRGSEVLDVPTALMRKGDFSEVPNITQYGIFNPYSTVGPDKNGVFARSAFGTPITPNGCDGSIVGGLAVNPTAATCNFSTQIPATISTPNGPLPGLDPTAQFFVKSYPLPNYNSPLSSCPMGKGGYLICGNYLGSEASSQVSENVSLKIDHGWSQRSRYFFEWLYNPGKDRNYLVPWTGPAYPNEFVGFNSRYPTDSSNQVLGIGNTYTLSPTLVNEFHASFTRQILAVNESALGDVMNVPAVEKQLAPLKIPSSQFYPVPTWQMSSPGGGNLYIGPALWSNVMQMGEAYTISDNIIKIIGKHTLKTGFMYRLEHGAWGGSFPTQFNFGGGSLTTNPVTGQGGGGGLSQFLMGAIPQNIGNATGLTPPFYARWRYWGGFVQDEFRVTSRLTWSIGLRYDLYGYFKTRWNPPASRFCFTCTNDLTGLSGKVIYTGDPQLPKGGDVFPANHTDFAPRVNFSWAPFGGQQTVIRGGYDMFYSDAVNATNYPGEGPGYQPGWFANTTWSGSWYPSQCPAYSGQCVAFPLSDTTTDKASITTPPLFGSTLPAQQRSPLLGSSLIFVGKPSRDPMVQRYGLEIQRELPYRTMVSAGYVGNLGTHLVGDYARSFDYVHPSDVIRYRTGINAVVPITDYYSGQAATALASIYGSTSLPRSLLLLPYPAFTGLTQLPVYDGTSIYHALNLRVQKRTSHGVTFILAYTLSKKITDPVIATAAAFVTDPIHTNRPGELGGRIGANGTIYGGGYQNIDNRKGDRALASDDIPQMFNLAATYELPFGVGRAFLNQRGILNGVLGGWRLSGTFNAQSGIPLEISGPCDQLTCRPDLVGNPRFAGNRSKAQQIQQWINPAAFQPVFGNDQNFWAHYDPTDPRAYLWGTAGPVLPTLRAPGFWNLDTALVKRFKITESKALEVRWEAFNALNHQNLGYPNTSYCLPPGPNGETDTVRLSGCSFGRITNIATDPRNLEFATKFIF